MAKVLVFGSSGWIGSRIMEALEDAEPTRADITDPEAVRAEIRRVKPDSVVNAAGKTGKPNVDWCESHPHETYHAFITGPIVLSRVCAEEGVHFVNLGTGCIFYGDSPDPKGWREDDFANPTATYTRAKYASDLALSMLPNVAILRLRMPIEGIPGPRNLITKLASFQKVTDVENSVSVLEDVINALKVVVEKKASGIFHTVNAGTMRHRDLINLYEEIVDPSHSCEWITPKELVSQGIAVKARSNCIMQDNRLPEIGVHMRPIDVALRACMEEYAEHLKKGTA